MSVSPEAGSAARNQYGTFQVHYASDAQQKYIRNLVTQRVVPDPAPEAFAPLLGAVADNKLNKKAASRLIDWLLSLPHARRSDGTPRATAPTGFNPEWRLSTKQFDLIRKLAAERPEWPTHVGQFQKEADAIAAVTDPDATADTVEVTKREASAAIDFLFAAPRPERKTQPVDLEAGMYRTADGVIYKVYKAVHGSGMMCAKELVIERTCEGHTSTNGPIGNVEYCDGTCGSGETEAHFEYRGLATRFVTADQRMTLEDAKKFGAIYGVCCQCGATLTAEASIEAGIGPICAGKI